MAPKLQKQPQPQPLPPAAQAPLTKEDMSTMQAAFKSELKNELKKNNETEY